MLILTELVIAHYVILMTINSMTSNKNPLSLIFLYLYIVIVLNVNIINI